MSIYDPPTAPYLSKDITNQANKYFENVDTLCHDTNPLLISSFY